MTWQPKSKVAFDKLTNEQLAETANVLLAQVDRADLRVTYAGNGWFHRTSTYDPNKSYAGKERRKDVERTIAGLHNRIARNAAERPEKERQEREWKAHERLSKAAPDLLAALQATAKHIDDDMNGRPVALWKLRETVLAAIAKATEEKDNVNRS